MVKEVISDEVYRKVCAERDAYKDLVEHCAIGIAVMRFGSIGAGRQVSMGEYVFRVWSDSNGAHAEVVSQ